MQEVPGEISICFSIAGCSLRCEGCHSPFLWKTDLGRPLTRHFYESTLRMYKSMASCVLFMGGESYVEILCPFLKYAKEMGYKTCLYTGEDIVDQSILEQLTWLKTGRWIEEKGGLDNPKTNQLFIEVKTNRLLNHLFKKQIR